MCVCVFSFKWAPSKEFLFEGQTTGLALIGQGRRGLLWVWLTLGLDMGVSGRLGTRLLHPYTHQEGSSKLVGSSDPGFLESHCPP